MENFNLLMRVENVPEAYQPGFVTICPLAELTWADIVPITDRRSPRNYSNLSLERSSFNER